MKFYRLFCFLVIVATGLNACSPDKELLPQERALALATTQVVEESLPLHYTAVGNIVSDHRVEISSKIAGYIRSIEVVEGTSVQRGQLLVSLDDNDVRAAITQARSVLSSAKAQLDDAEADLKRYQSLLDEDSISEARVRKTRLLRDTAKDRLNSANAALSRALSQRQYTTIKSPVDGLVVARYGRNGDLANPGVPILSVESKDGLLFQTYLPEQHLDIVKVGDTVSLDLNSQPGTIKGKILRLVPSADPVTRRFKVDIAFPEESLTQKSLIPGMFGRTHFLLGSIIHPVIPTAALFERGGLEGVFVLGDDKRARFRWLRLGRKLSSTTEVIAGLKGGETILSKAQPGLPEGSLITSSSISDRSVKNQDQGSPKAER